MSTPARRHRQTRPYRQRRHPSRHSRQSSIRSRYDRARITITVHRQMHTQQVQLPSNIAYYTNTGSPIRSSPSRRHVDRKSPSKSKCRPNNVFVVTPIQLKPLHSNSYHSPMSHPHLTCSTHRLRQPQVATPHRQEHSANGPTPVMRPQPHTARVVQRRHTTYSISLPSPPPGTTYHTIFMPH